MGLDVYVGPLCRYYAGDWKLIVQQAAEAAGEGFRIIRPGGQPPPGSLPDTATAREGILAWRAAVGEAAGGELPTLEWDETPDAGYFTDKPDWNGYLALRLLAGALEFPEQPRPAMVGRNPSKTPLLKHIDDIYVGRQPGIIDRLLRRSPSTDAPKSRRRYAHLHVPEIWLPLEIPEPFSAQDPTGNPTMFGSLPRLVAELEDINRQSLRLDEQGLKRISQQGPPDSGAMLEKSAAFGLAMFLEAARYGVAHDHPMKLDY